MSLRELRFGRRRAAVLVVYGGQLLDPASETFLVVREGRDLHKVQSPVQGKRGLKLFKNPNDLPELRPLVRMEGPALLDEGSEGRRAVFRDFWSQALQQSHGS